MEPTNYTLEQLTTKYNLTCIDEDDEELFVSIMNGNFDTNINTETANPLMLNYIGLYYEFVEINYDEMKKYYIILIDYAKYNPSDYASYSALYNLGNYYKDIEKNYEMMEKYYLMLLDNALNDENKVELYSVRTFIMNTLGNYYEKIKENYDLMKKYYLMAIDNIKLDEKFNTSNEASYYAMNNLGNYYKNIEINEDLMKKYYMMAIDNGNKLAMTNLGNYYIELSKKYFYMAKLKTANIKEECSICYGENKQMYYTHCNNHHICRDCCVKLIDKTCPICRQ
jgi:tetratricopeptide (TPR) repeat protein